MGRPVAIGIPTVVKAIHKRKQFSQRLILRARLGFGRFAMRCTVKVIWPGLTGNRYVYEVYRIGTPFKSVPGNYIFARWDGGRWTNLYTGETGDLSERFTNHHKEPCVLSRGATHLHVHQSSTNAATRRAEEGDIIKRHRPPCNG